MKTQALRGLVLPLLLLLAWEITSHAELMDPRILPPVEKVALTAVNQVMHEGLLLSMSTLFDEVASAVFDGLPASASRVV